ncbi:MAG: PilZ domain-containing protein [Gammaproteobacteria bacterium]|jgi:hypothetical protein|nr:PilZ domain-containing protein [Gammaproteobacteria bacterium]
MDNDGASQFGEGLVYEDTVPLCWRELGNDISTPELLRTHQSNERVLRYFAALDEYRGEAADEEHGHVAHELTRLEFKTNLLLDMVARLLVEHVSMPAAVPVKMSGAGIQWYSQVAPAVGGLLSVDIYLNQRYPSPITLYGEVSRVLPVEGGFQVDLSYRDMSDTLRSWLEKLIFRHHRRLVAHSRQQGRV